MSMNKLYQKKKGSTEVEELNGLFSNEPVQIKQSKKQQQQQKKKNQKNVKKMSVEEMEIEDILDQNNEEILGKQNQKQKKNSLDQAIEQEGLKKKTDNLEQDNEDEKVDNPFNEDDLTVKQKQDRDEKTIFIGNVPLEGTKKELIKLFKTYGKIENIRERSVPIRASKNLSVKARVILKKTVGEKSEQENLVKNCYILFESKEAAEKSLEKNGFEFKGNYLRVDSANQKDLDFTKTIFIGNLSYSTTENDLRRHFMPCGNILNVRVIRDKETHQGKGFGYVEFQKDEGYQKSLELKGSSLNDRQLRIKKAVPKARLEKKKARKVEIQLQNADYAQKRIEQKMRNQAEGQGKKFIRKEDDDEAPKASKFFKNKQAQQFSENTMENYDNVDINNKIVIPPRFVRKTIKKAKQRGQNTFHTAQKAEKKFHERNDKNIFNNERGLKARRADREKRRNLNSKKPKAQVINE